MLCNVDYRGLASDDFSLPCQEVIRLTADPGTLLLYRPECFVLSSTVQGETAADLEQVFVFWFFCMCSKLRTECSQATDGSFHSLRPLYNLARMFNDPFSSRCILRPSLLPLLGRVALPSW